MIRHLAGREVFPIGLGAMPLSIEGRPDEPRAIATIHAALDSGMTLIDTADVYCLDDTEIGHNERLIAKALAEWPGETPLVATKGGCTRPGGAWGHDGRPAHLRAACEASLSALGIERIDLYQLHAPDAAIPLEESVGELARLVLEGKIAHVGLSNVSLAELECARGVTDVVSVQNRASPYHSGGLGDGVLAACESHDIAYIAHSPVGGYLAHRTAHEEPLRAVAAELDASPFEVALAWLLARSPALIPIPGASRPENARSSARAAELALEAAQIARLNEAYR
jgi:aryl-alcohol dehydrogenase-like predicted oxidoreductase